MHSRLKGALAAAGIAAVLATGPAVTRPAAASDTIVVRPGDTLTGIALQHGMTVEQLVHLNRISDPNRIYAGQTLRLKPEAAGSGAGSSDAAIPRTHDVRFGETLTGIARRYGTTIGAIVVANHLPDASRILAGDRLLIPGRASAPAPAAAPKPPPAPAPAAAPRTHRVRPGETLTAIARTFGSTISAIAAANEIENPSFVRAGTLLRIPGGTAPPASRGPAVPESMARLVASRGAVRHVIDVEARHFGVPTALALALAWQESGWQQGVTSGAGAIGVMQLLPATGEWVGPGLLGSRVDLRDTRQNIRAGVRLLRYYLDRYHGDRALALAAYYQGQTAVDRHGIYPMSRPYIASILYLERLFG